MPLKDSEIQELKRKHGEVFEVQVADKVGYVRKPTRRDLSYAMMASNGGKDPIAMNESILNNCWLGGDEELRTEDAYFFGVSEVLGDLMEKKQAELKKL